MTVTKVVDIVLRIPEQLILYFSEFYTILYGIYKFAAFDSSVHVSFSLRPLGFCFFSGEVPGGSSEQSRERARHFPARRVTGGEGKVGENGEGLESYLWVVVAHRERV